MTNDTDGWRRDGRTVCAADGEALFVAEDNLCAARAADKHNAAMAELRAEFAAAQAQVAALRAALERAANFIADLPWADNSYELDKTDSNNQTVLQQIDAALAATAPSAPPTEPMAPIMLAAASKSIWDVPFPMSTAPKDGTTILAVLKPEYATFYSAIGGHMVLRWEGNCDGWIDAHKAVILSHQLQCWWPLSPTPAAPSREAAAVRLVELIKQRQGTVRFGKSAGPILTLSNSGYSITSAYSSAWGDIYAGPDLNAVLDALAGAAPVAGEAE